MKALLFGGLFLLSTFTFGQKYFTESGSVVFISKAPLSEFTGESENLNGLVDLDKNLLDFFLDLNTLDTGIGLRDRHMRENYLETEEFPFAEFTGEMNALPELAQGEKKAVKAVGKFTIHGVEREIEVNGFLTRLNTSELLLDAEFEVLLGDHDIPLPKLVFYELAENQTVQISATLKSKK